MAYRVKASARCACIQSPALRAPIDQRRLGSPHRVRAVLCRVKAKLLDPALKDSGVLPRSQVR